MKKIILAIVLLVAGFSLEAQNQQAYMNAMAKGLQALGTANTMEELQSVAGQFERIGANVQDQWHPQYYAALAYINMSFRTQVLKEKDQFTDKAQTFIDAALKLDPNNSEIVALQGYKYMIELSADSGNRGQSMSPKAMMHLGKALTLDPENPRANIFMAQMEIGMAQFFGSPIEKPCQKVTKAVELFEGQPHEQSFNPKWGMEMAEGLIQQCSK